MMRTRNQNDIMSLMTIHKEDSFLAGINGELVSMFSKEYLC